MSADNSTQKREPFDFDYDHRLKVFTILKDGKYQLGAELRECKAGERYQLDEIKATGGFSVSRVIEV